MKTLVVANWKMNPQSLVQAKRLFNSLRKDWDKKGIEVVVCPPFIYLGSRSVKLGAQNCFWGEKGAFTGEISVKMLKNIGCSYIIVGHSERRDHFKETNEIVNKKLKLVLRTGLKAILCVGETKKGEPQKILESQLKKDLKGVPLGQLKNLVIAYEPVWAIGTGKASRVDQAVINLLFIRKIVSRLYSSLLTKKVQILYGGSVNSKNAAGFIKAGFNGLLIGGSSLNPQEFLKILRNV